MPRNGSGAYSLPSGNPVVTGTTISSTTHNSTMSDIATALTQSISSTGVTTPSANLPMGGFKLTGLGAGSSNGESVRYEQLILKADKAGDTFTGGITMSGASIVETEGAPVASASTTNIWATDGNTVHVTGTTTITSFGTAPQAGAWMKVIFDGALILTQSADLNLNGGGSNITTEAEDMALVYADTTTQMDVFVIRKNGRSIADAAIVFITSSTVGSAVASVDFLSNFSSTYDNYLIKFYNVSVATADKLALRCATGGAADTGNNYAYQTETATTANTTYNESSSTTASLFRLANANIDPAVVASGEIRISNVNSSGSHSIFSEISFKEDTTAQRIWAKSGGEYFAANTVSGIRFLLESGNNIDSGTFVIYGYSKS